MDMEKAARETLIDIDNCTQGYIQPKRDTEGSTVAHIRWMLEGISEGYVQYEKAHRWLGYAQGLAVAKGVLTLEQAKEINKNA